MYNLKKLTNLLSPANSYSINLPNELFEHVKENIDRSKRNASEHIAFAYTFVYLISYLYRNVRFGDFDFSEPELKKILGFSGNNKNLNYITKRNGILNKLGYIKKETDIPLRYFPDENGYPVFEMYSEHEIFDEIGYNPRNSKINYPIKAFHRIPIHTFIYCLSNKEIGVVGLYIYSYLKHKNDIFKKGFSCPLEKLKVETGIKKTTLNNYLKTLEEHNMIDNDHQPYVLDLKAGEQVHACTYKTKPYGYFIKNGEKREVKVRQIITKKTYDENMEAQEKEQNEINPFL
jgi:hypothetical protein